MAIAASTVDAMSDTEHRRQLRRALIASTVGTTIEWYDFLLYGTVSALVFGPLFFPKSDPLMGVLQSFGIFFIGFVGRPIGAAIFGHWGDRLGRKSALIATLMLMGVATFLVGLVPTYDNIGIWGAILLTVLRFIQGVGVGGEWVLLGRGVGARDAVGEDLRAHRVGHARDVEQVLDAHGHAVQRTFVGAVCDLLLGGPCRRPRFVAHDPDVSVQRAVEPFV